MDKDKIINPTASKPYFSLIFSIEDALYIISVPINPTINTIVPTTVSKLF